MALKPTIYKFNISLSDLDRNHYDSLSLTVAQHPSETRERMMARVLAYCINAQERLNFSRGLSATDEPDLWVKTLDEQIALWIEVGEPSAGKIKKALRMAEQVRIYSFNTKSESWWQQLDLDRGRVSLLAFRFRWGAIEALAGLVERTMTMSVTISNESAYFASGLGECEVAWTKLD